MLQKKFEYVDQWRWSVPNPRPWQSQVNVLSRRCRWLRQHNRGYHLEVDYEELLTQAPGEHVVQL